MVRLKPYAVVIAFLFFVRNSYCIYNIIYDIFYYLPIFPQQFLPHYFVEKGFPLSIVPSTLKQWRCCMGKRCTADQALRSHPSNTGDAQGVIGFYGDRIGIYLEQPWEKMECHPYKCSIYPGIYRDLQGFMGISLGYTWDNR